MRPDRNETHTRLSDALAGSREVMDPPVKADVRARVMEGAGRPRGFLVTAPRRIAVALAVTTALSGGVAYAADGALPGDFLYPVKRAIENAIVAVLPEGDLERTALVEIARRRAEEAAQLQIEGPAELSTDSLRELRDALEQVAEPGGLTREEEAQIRESAGEQGGPVHETVDDVVGSSGEEPGVSGPSGPAGDTDTSSDADSRDGSSGSGTPDAGSGTGASPGPSDAGSGDSPSSGQDPAKGR